ncbi:MAG: hypothetical protein COT74_10760 [Bdellovibrionales bacterium CG10_big_fil_rev_8_21_14_0_10_45_34]|nr:MAG: hypothetical protein COT74_10760 [Bdellovibrionales bacterium CG10_big_fil_rev_8_21_14_0_10_45_34]
MNFKLKKLMLPFYFGSVTEAERLLVEREILGDPEVLIDYLDLKRKVEGADCVAAQPSPSLWKRLAPTTSKQKKAWLLLSLGTAAAACLTFLFVSRPVPETTEFVQPSANRALFDSSSELSASSNVL